MGIDKQNLLRRVITAVIMVVALIVVFYIGGFLFNLLVTAAALLSFYEYRQLTEKMGKKIPAVITLTGGLAVLGNQILSWGFPWSIIFITVFILMGIQLVLTYPGMDFTGVGLGMFGIFYTFLFYTFFIEIRSFPDGFFWLLFVMALIWIGDTAAYFVGMTLGKSKLSPELSPKKSIEGALGGIIFTVLTAVAVGSVTTYFSLLEGIGLGIVVAVVAIFGDLLESAIKRSAGVKDSGRFFPGHGGILDRFDSALFVLPVAYYYIAYLIF